MNAVLCKDGKKCLATLTDGLMVKIHNMRLAESLVLTAPPLARYHQLGVAGGAVPPPPQQKEQTIKINNMARGRSLGR